MTYRHYLAHLESISNEKAAYAFTPDSIIKPHWGRVVFSLSNFSYQILELAPDPNSDVARQQTVCDALAFKLRKAREANPENVPETLEFIA